MSFLNYYATLIRDTLRFNFQFMLYPPRLDRLLRYGNETTLGKFQSITLLLFHFAFTDIVLHIKLSYFKLYIDDFYNNIDYDFDFDIL